MTEEHVDLGDVCPACGEPWLRPTNLLGRYRCVNCLHRFELRSVCPNCGEHSTIVRMSDTALHLQPLQELDAPAHMTALHGVAPSILAADFARLGAQVEEVMEAGARTIHVDVMDGHFVPPITMGALAVDALAEQVHGAGGILDVHLMIERPERHISDFAKAGADNITIHAEATPHPLRGAGDPRGRLRGGARALPGHARAGGVGPGHRRRRAAGDDRQSRLGRPGVPPELIPKLERARALLGPGPAIEVDGGIDADTAGPCASAGATAFVAGTAVFGAADPGAAYQEITAATQR